MSDTVSLNYTLEDAVNLGLPWQPQILNIKPDSSTNPCETNSAICDVSSILGKEGEQFKPDVPELEIIKGLYNESQNKAKRVDCCAEVFDNDYLVKKISQRASSGNTYLYFGFLSSEIGEEYMDFFCLLGESGFKVEPSINYFTKAIDFKISWE